eukprot:m.70235 g.70235  ORF g.70235 m.70235 type:complete len:67 (+) comp12117_c0_seq3:744-944(+)
MYYMFVFLLLLHHHSLTTRIFFRRYLFEMVLFDEDIHHYTCVLRLEEPPILQNCCRCSSRAKFSPC